VLPTSGIEKVLWSYVFLNRFSKTFGMGFEIYKATTLKIQFSHKQLVLVNGPCFYRGLSFCIKSNNGSELPVLMEQANELFLRSFLEERKEKNEKGKIRLLSRTLDNPQMQF